MKEENELTQINVPISKKLLAKFDETWPKVYPHFSERQGRSAVIRDLIHKFNEAQGEELT